MSDPTGKVSRMDDLDRQVLALVGAHYRHDGLRLQAARDLGFTPTGYLARVNRLIDDPAANVAEPALCARLRRQRDTAAKVRSMRRLVA